jgi:hypothetical protein
MDIHGYACTCKHIYGYVRLSSMDIHGYPWISVDIHRYPYISMDIHGFPYVSMDIHGYSWICTNIHGYVRPVLRTPSDKSFGTKRYR